ncbi:diguanylate cyclase/phosphodiesterase (GGDEF & EAL domains) with PAS/PAC sensor(s) [hydrothermal vent metagenome]|uniref:histidine kinase n=1 Tax=hydrothermal vent metagenome TaxID=652676 RepID=A0A3B1BX64_9ZZZZ
MTDTHRKEKMLGKFNRYIFGLVVAWTVIIASLLAMDFFRLRTHYIDLAKNEAIVHFNWITTFRSWVSSHGGVYVPIDERTPPNKYLITAERDIVGPFKRPYTLVNPAYMTRQVFEMYGGALRIKGHLTSLTLLRPENAPDKWEKNALIEFDKGRKEKIELTEISDEPYLRMMRPLIAEQSCLRCHGHQGYKVGDVRGGISISVPLAPYIARQRAEAINHGLFFGLIMFLGLGGIGMVSVRLRSQVVEQAKIEDDLEISEQKMSAILKTVGEGVVVVDEHSTIQYINQAAQNIFGYTQGELIGSHFTVLVPEKYRTAHISNIENYLSGKPSNLFGIRREFDALRKSGEVFPVDVIVEKTSISEDHQLFTAAIRDITLYKRNQQSIIKKSELIQLLQDIAVASNEAPTIDEAMLTCLEKVCAHTGWEIGHVYYPDSDGTLQPTTLWRETSDKMVETFHEVTMRTILKSGVGLPGRAHRSGRAVWITDLAKETNFPRAKVAEEVGVKAAFAFPVLEEKKVTAVLEFFTVKAEEPDESLLDAVEILATQLGRVTERKRAEEEHSRLAAAIEHAADTVMITDAHGTIQYVNPAFERIYGFSRSEAIGQNPRMLKSDRYGPEFYDEMWKTIRNGISWKGKFINKKKDGTLCEDETTITPVIGVKGKILGYVAVKRDVTKEAYFVSAKEFFASVTAHELRTPMTTLGIVKAYLDSIETLVKDKDNYNRARESMDISYMHLERILTLTSMLSDLNKPLVKKHFGPGFFNMVITSLVDSTRSLISDEKRTIDLNLTLSPEFTNSSFNGNQEMLSMAVDEALSNAIKFTRDGGAVDVKGYIEEGDFVVEIKNEGQGIPKNMLDKVTEPFFSLEDPMKHSSGRHKYMGGGIGLGLTITRLIVERHSGKLEIRSEGEKKGVTALIKIPVDSSEPPPDSF